MKDQAKELTAEQIEAIKRKQAAVNRGLYAPIPHRLYREELPRLQGIYGNSDARDAIFIYTYLHAFVNGEAHNTAYMWAFPNVEKIRKDTGIHGDRIKPLVDILDAEGLVITKYIPWNGSRKKMYMPIYNDRLLGDK